MVSQDLQRGHRRRQFEAQALPHMGALYGTALRLCHNQKDAEDLVQDTFLRAYQAWDEFDRNGRCKPWLFRILTNTFVNRYRRRVLEQRVRGTLEGGVEGPASLMGAASRRASEAPEGLLSDDVQQALDALPEEFRLAVLLCDLEDFSYREIADIMGCPVGTVMSRLYRGRRLLQEQLRDYAAPSRAAEGTVVPLRPRRGKEV